MRRIKITSKHLLTLGLLASAGLVSFNEGPPTDDSLFLPVVIKAETTANYGVDQVGLVIAPVSEQIIAATQFDLSPSQGSQQESSPSGNAVEPDVDLRDEEPVAPPDDASADDETDSGNGNAGGNGQGNGNAGGNGQGNGNAGGNGQDNGNAGGNGQDNGNAGGNGQDNGNAGGNGQGNGNDGGNGQGNGNSGNNQGDPVADLAATVKAIANPGNGQGKPGGR